MKTVKEHLIEMLTENTGVHMCDSGGDNGRMWQRNQGKDFESEPRITWDIWNNEITETVSTYHYLSEILEVDQFTESVNEFLRSKNVHWAGEAIEALEGLDVFADEPYIMSCGVRCFISKVSDLYNTYNYENNLSQVLQFCTFARETTPGDFEVYVILQIHGGADVRGGYTAARCFGLNGYLTGQVDVYGTIDGKEVENTYNGWCLTTEDGEQVEVNEKSEVCLDFHIIEETYFYLDS